jgi:hypothetical protein
VTREGSGRRVGRRIGAVAAGLLVAVLPALAADAALRAAGVFPPAAERLSDALLLLAAGYRALFAIAGCWLAARLAPDRPMAHALALGALGLAAGLAGVAVAWRAGPEFGPLWYPIAVAASAPPCAWAGGALGRRRLALVEV